MATFVITAEANTQLITVVWAITGTEPSQYANIKIAINELSTPTGKVYFTIPLGSSNYSGGSYDITELDGVELKTGSSYSISASITSKTGYKPKKSNTEIVEVLKSPPIDPSLNVTGGDGVINVAVTNMYNNLANQGYSALTDMWITIVNDVTGEESFYNYDVSANPNYLEDNIQIEASNNILYEGTVTIFNIKGSSETQFSVTPSNLPKITRNLLAYPTVMYNQVEGITDINGLTTDASSISVFWQRPINYDVLISSNKPITSYVINRTCIGDATGNKIITVSTVTNDPYYLGDLNFNGITYNNKYIDTDVVVGKSYDYSIILTNINGESPEAMTASSVTCGSLPSTPIISTEPSDNLFTLNLITSSVLNGFSSKGTGELYTLDFVSEEVSAFFDLSLNSSITITNLPLNNVLNASATTITNGTDYELSMIASTSYTINGITTIFNSKPFSVTVSPYGIPSAPTNVRVFALDSSVNAIPVTDASGNPGLKVLWDSVTNLRGNTNPTYSVYINYNNNNYLTNITDVDNSATEYIVSSYTNNNTTVLLSLGTEYSIYIVTKTYNLFNEIYVQSNTINYYNATPLTYPSAVNNLSLTNTSSTTMVASFTAVSGTSETGGFLAANIQYAYTLLDISSNSVVNSGTITGNTHTFTNLLAGSPYNIKVYTQGLYTSIDTSSNSPAGPTFINRTVQDPSNKSSASKISYYSPEAPQNVEVAAIYNDLLTYSARVYWDIPQNVSNYISNGVKITKYLIYCVESSYSGSLTSIPSISTQTDITSEYAIINQYYSSSLATTQSMVNGGKYKVYVAAQGIVGGYTISSYNFTSETITGEKSTIMYDHLLENPLTNASGVIQYITTSKGLSNPTGLNSSSQDTSVTVNWYKDPSATEYIIYRGNNNVPYIKSFLQNGSFTNLVYNSQTNELSFTNEEPLTYTYYISAVANGVQSYTSSITAGPNAPPGDVSDTTFSVEDSTVTINWISPSNKSTAGQGTNSNLYTKIILFNSSYSQVSSQIITDVILSTYSSVTFTGLTNNNTYSAEIQSYYNVNGSSTSQAVSNVVTVSNMIPNPPPADATFTTITTSDGLITLNWSKPTDYLIYPFATTFTIVRTGVRPDGISSQFDLGKTVNVLNSITTYTDTLLNNGYKYTYKLIANRTTTLQPSGVTTSSYIIPSGKPQFASTITSLGLVNGKYKYTVTMDRNGSDLTGSSFIGIPSSLTASSLLFDSTDNFTGISYGNTTTNELLTNQLYQYTFGFSEQVSAVFLSVSNANGMVTGSSNSAYFASASDNSTA